MLHSDMTEVPPTTFQRSQAEVNNDITLETTCHNNRIRSVSATAMHDSKFASTFWKGTQHGKQDFPCYFEIRELNIDIHRHAQPQSSLSSQSRASMENTRQNRLIL